MRFRSLSDKGVPRIPFGSSLQLSRRPARSETCKCVRPHSIQVVIAVARKSPNVKAAEFGLSFPIPQRPEVRPMRNCAFVSARCRRFGERVARSERPVTADDSAAPGVSKERRNRCDRVSLIGMALVYS
jgi:hypothetical protein